MNSPARAFLSLLVLCIIGTGIFFGVIMGLDIYNALEKPSIKKNISVKPENIKGKQALVNPSSIDENRFTFFDTLDDPSMSKFIGLNEKVIEPQKTTNKISNLAPETKKINILQSDIVNAKKSLNSVKANIFFMMLSSSSSLSSDKSISAGANKFSPCSAAVRKILQIRAYAY